MLVGGTVNYVGGWYNCATITQGGGWYMVHQVRVMDGTLGQGGGWYTRSCHGGTAGHGGITQYYATDMYRGTE